MIYFNKIAASNQVIKEAANILLSIDPNLSDSALEILLAQVQGESDFGYAFKTPDGSPSHNWGAVMRPGTKGTIPVKDSVEGKAVTQKAAWNESAYDGAKVFYDVVRGRYSDALQKAQNGDLWGYSEGLFKKGYYGGFPPGHKWGAPADVIPKSPLDNWYRILNYAKMIQGGATRIANIIGKPVAFQLNIPPKPENIPTQATPKQTFKVKKKKKYIQPPADISEEISNLFSISNNMNKQKLYKKLLPINYATIKIYGDDFTNKIEFARLLTSVLDEELNSRSFIHNSNNFVEVQCNINGPSKECFSAINMIVNETNKVFKKKVINSNITASLNINKKSSYKSAELDTIEQEHKRFLLKFI